MLFISALALTPSVEALEEQPPPVIQGDFAVQNPVYCSCVQTTRLYTDYEVPRQDADKFVPNTTPHIGSLIIFHYTNTAHVAVIVGFDEDGYVVEEGNKEECQQTTRVVDYNDPFIVGFWRPETERELALEKIAMCESNNQHYDETGAVLRGRITPEDIGRYQINEYFWGQTARNLGYNIYTEEGNRAMAEFLYDTYGPQPWSASAACHRLV